MAIELEVVADPGRACAAMLVEVAVQGGHIVLTGGSTPRGAYSSFAETVRAERIDVSGVTMWFGDERCVAPDDERSNYGMVRESLLAPLAGQALPDVHRMRGELGPVEAAEEYELQLRAAGPPRFDLLLLGIGSDGHCASLFPDQPSLQERSRLVVGVERAGLEPYVPRVTMTLPALVAARRVVFLATGGSKAHAVASAFGPAARPDPHVPSSLVAAEAGEVKVLLDAAAADGLGSSPGAV